MYLKELRNHFKQCKRSLIFEACYIAKFIVSANERIKLKFIIR